MTVTQNKGQKILVVNTHPFSDKKLMSKKNRFVFVSTTGPYPRNERKYDMKSIIARDTFYNAVKHTISLSGAPLFIKELRFMRILLKEKPDIIFCNISEITLSTLSYFYKLIFRKKLYLYNEFWRYSKTLFFALLERFATFLLKHADSVYCIGSVHEAYLKKQGVTKIKRIPPVYHRVIQKKDLLEKKNLRRLDLIYVGRIVPYKGLDRLLRVFAHLQNKYDIFLQIIGGQYIRDQYPGKKPNFEKDCREFAEKHLKKDSYNFLGFKENAIDYIKKSNLLILPNRFVNDRVPCEAWGIVCAEALINDVPVVATTAVGSAFDLIENGKNGFLVSAKSEKELHKGIEKALLRLGAKKLALK